MHAIAPRRAESGSEFIVWQTSRGQNTEHYGVAAQTHGPKENTQQIVNSFFSSEKETAKERREEKKK